MSKLSKAIDATFTGDITAARRLKLKYVDINKSVMDDPSAYLRHYKVSATFGSSRVIDKFSLERGNTNISEECLNDMKRAIIEEVFGEFRPFLYEMRSALYEDDMTRIRQLLAEMDFQMFSEGI